MSTIRVIEIGGTHIRRADVIGTDVLNLEIRRTREVLSDSVLANLQVFAQEKWNDDIGKLMILIAGPVKDNIVGQMPNFPEFPCNIDLTKELKFNVPIFVFNDMTAAVIGMADLLKKQNIDQAFWGLTWSTGLGGKFWDGQKISVDTEIGHEILLDNIEAEKLLGGRHLAKTAGESEAQLMGQFLLKLDEIASSNLYIFKGAISKELLTDQKIADIIKSAFSKDIKIMLSPEPDKDSFIGAIILSEQSSRFVPN